MQEFACINILLMSEKLNLLHMNALNASDNKWKSILWFFNFTAFWILHRFCSRWTNKSVKILMNERIRWIGLLLQGCTWTWFGNFWFYWVEVMKAQLKEKWIEIFWSTRILHLMRVLLQNCFKVQNQDNNSDLCKMLL